MNLSSLRKVLHRVSLPALCVIFLFSRGFAELPPLSKGAWTVVVLPDTQFYCRITNDTPLFAEMTQWIVDQREARDIRLVLHVGDVVTFHKEEEWARAKQCLQVLDGKIPYVLAAGNHDFVGIGGNRETMLNRYFKVGDNPLNEKMFGGFYREGELQNAWYLFHAGERDILIFSLEFGPRKEVVAWANGVAAEQAGTPMILLTHEFIDQKSALVSDDGLPRRSTPQTENNPYGYVSARSGTNVMCGEELWQNFVSQHADFRLVINGHYKTYTKERKRDLFHHVEEPASVCRSDPNGSGITHQMLFNAQWAPRGGNGWLRLLEFQPDGKTVQVRTFSPYLARTSTDPAAATRRDKDCEFCFEF